MNTKKCLKCGHVASFEGSPPQACPGCDAIYAKVEAAAQGSAPLRAAAPKDNPYVAPVSMRPPAGKTGSASSKRHRSTGAVADFAAVMRSESLYPTWRELVKWVTLFWYAVAAISLIGTVIGSKAAFVPTLIAFGAALFIVIVARVSKELSLMLADMSDAAVRIAARESMGEAD